MWLLDFCSSLSKDYLREYMELLANFSHRLSPSGFADAALFADILDMAMEEQFSESSMVILQFCRKFHEAHPGRSFSSLSKNWFRARYFGREHHAQVMKWAAHEKGEILDFLSQISPPSDMSPDERKAAKNIWKTRLENKPALWRQDDLPDETRISIQNQLYLLSESREEQFQVLQDVLPILMLSDSDSSLLSIWLSTWGARLIKHCREYPENERPLREYCLNLIYHPVSDGDHQPAVREYVNQSHEYKECKKILGGWFGIVHIGAGEFESRLLDIVRTQAAREMPGYMNEKMKWVLLSQWQPVSPTVQAELLDWWQSLPVTTAHASFQPRWKALFSLEKDESRLVQLIEELPDNVFPQEIPDGWFPHSPQLQKRLMKAVPERLNAFIAQINQGIIPPKSLWQLLFRLPVSGSRILDFIHRSASAANSETDFLSHITDFLQSPGLPPDTSKEDIRQAVEIIVGHQKQQYNQFNSFGIKNNVSMVVVELLREYVRCGTPEPAVRGETAIDCAGIDPAWLQTILEFLIDINHEVDSLVTNISENWRETSPPCAQFLIHNLWLATIRRLATRLSIPQSQDQSQDVDEYKNETLLWGLLRLTREVYPPSGSEIDRSGGITDHPVRSTPYPFPPQLWETLSTVVMQTRNEKTFFLTASIGNYLARHATPEQRQHWGRALKDSMSNLAAGTSDVLHRHFLLQNLVSELERFREENPGEHTSDATALLRFLRQRMHLFPDHPGTGRGFWAKIWEKAFQAWRMEYITRTPIKTRNRAERLPVADFIAKLSLSPLPADSGQTASIGLRPGSPVPNRQ